MPGLLTPGGPGWGPLGLRLPGPVLGPACAVGAGFVNPEAGDLERPRFPARVLGPIL